MTVTLVGAAASWIIRAVVWSPERQGLAYVSTFTRADGLLLGCFMGQLYACQSCRQLRALSGRPEVGVVAVGTLLALVGFLHEGAASSFYVGLGVAGLASAALVLHLVERQQGPPSPASRVLGARVLTAVGRRAYSIYLWQNLVMFALATPLATSWTRWPVSIVLIAVAAEISYRLVERPFMGARAAESPPAPAHDQLSLPPGRPSHGRYAR